MLFHTSHWYLSWSMFWRIQIARVSWLGQSTSLCPTSLQWWKQPEPRTSRKVELSAWGKTSNDNDGKMSGGGPFGWKPPMKIWRKKVLEPSVVNVVDHLRMKTAVIWRLCCHIRPERGRLQHLFNDTGGRSGQVWHYTLLLYFKLTSPRWWREWDNWTWGKRVRRNLRKRTLSFKC